MTTSLSAAIRMHRASVAAPAPLAPGASAEPCAATMAVTSATWPLGGENRGTITPGFGSRPGSSDGSDRFGGITRPIIGGGWYRQDETQLAGGGPLRG
jgi:hypothetical protein